MIKLANNFSLTELQWDRLGSLRGDPTACWNWLWGKDSAGYGHVPVRLAGGRRTVVVAHRVAYHVWIGDIPDDMQLDHLCRNPSCINPSHLEPVTPRENVMRSKGQAYKNGVKTHCDRGHPLEGGNLAAFHNGWRVCRQCKRMKERERMQRVRRARGLKRPARSIPPLKELKV